MIKLNIQLFSGDMRENHPAIIDMFGRGEEIPGGVDIYSPGGYYGKSGSNVAYAAPDTAQVKGPSGKVYTIQPNAFATLGGSNWVFANAPMIAAGLVTWLYEQETGNTASSKDAHKWWQENASNIDIVGNEGKLWEALETRTYNSGNLDSAGTFKDVMEGREYSTLRRDINKWRDDNDAAGTLDNTEFIPTPPDANIPGGGTAVPDEALPGGAPPNVGSNTTGLSDAQAEAFNLYYRDIMNPNEGTGGSIYQNLYNANIQEARTAGVGADLGYQNQVMNQAAIVKQITDQVRSERMSRLRAGYSEVDIANQDMQMMMANVGALNDQAAAANQARLEAQMGQANAQGNAYRDYLANAQQLIQAGSAYAAAGAGSVQDNAQAYLSRVYPQQMNQWTPDQWREGYSIAQTGESKKSN